MKTNMNIPERAYCTNTYSGMFIYILQSSLLLFLLLLHRQILLCSWRSQKTASCILQELGSERRNTYHCWRQCRHSNFLVGRLSYTMDEQTIRLNTVTTRTSLPSSVERPASNQENTRVNVCLSENELIPPDAKVRANPGACKSKAKTPNYRHFKEIIASKVHDFRNDEAGRSMGRLN